MENTNTNKCNKCMEDAPYPYCCKYECGEHEFCKGCTAKSRECKRHDEPCD